MKKVLLLALLITSLSYAQEKAVEPAKRVLEDKNTISIGLIFSEPNSLVLNYERKKSDVSYFFKLNNSDIFSLGSGGIVVNFSNGKSGTGTGLIFGFGSKYYLKKEKWSGLYYQSLSEYGSIKFSDANYTGTYSYLSLFNGDIGYKWQVSKGFSIDPAIGLLWKLEFKGTGDVDNNIYTNFVPKIGLKMGYSFN
jgi:hypothetical protein